MNSSNSVGLYGKLPAHGDFVYRDLPGSFMNNWDQWLQGFVGSTKEQLGDAWLDIYLTSPIWRFAFSAGVLDESVWAGIVLPSVDRVGRYFPFSIAARLSADQNPLDIINQVTWYEAMESAALQALDSQLQIDDLVLEINGHTLTTLSKSNLTAPRPEQLGAVYGLQSGGQLPQSVFPSLLNAVLRESHPSYSVWSTHGSQCVAPCWFYCRGLPQMRGIAAMMEGRWDQWGWRDSGY